MKTLLIGSGGREHALAWKLAQSEHVSELICAPGNAGIAELCECAPIAADNIEGLVDLVKAREIGFVVVGPEQPLSLGITDALAKINVPCFGPSQAAAQLESSKAFMKDFCQRNDIPTARYEVFTDAAKAKAFLSTMTPPYVIKTDGLAAGKGVAIPETLEEAEAEIDAYVSGKFGAAGTRIVIEEFMQGEEISFFAVCDGTTAIPFGAAQDHKRVGDGDTGPNTGGMGAYAPAPIWTADMQAQVMQKIVLPTVKGMQEEGNAFTGILFAGLMLTAQGPKLIEYNVRFGDPECQVVMRQLQSDLYEVYYGAALGKLSEVSPAIWADTPTVNVVVCAKGYPASYAKGTKINVADGFNDNGVQLFHAGTKREGEQLVAAGGRVLNVTAQGDSLRAAVDAAYAAIDHKLEWDDGFCRRDIAWRAL